MANGKPARIAKEEIIQRFLLSRNKLHFSNAGFHLARPEISLEYKTTKKKKWNDQTPDESVPQEKKKRTETGVKLFDKSNKHHRAIKNGPDVELYIIGQWYSILFMLVFTLMWSICRVLIQSSMNSLTWQNCMLRDIADDVWCAQIGAMLAAYCRRSPFWTKIL